MRKATMKSDLTYISDGFFVTFMPNTDAGLTAWTAMISLCDDSKIPVTWLPSILSQLKQAGYTVRKNSGPKSLKWTKKDEKLLRELQS